MRVAQADYGGGRIDASLSHMRLLLALLLLLMPAAADGSKAVDARLSANTVHRDGIRSLSELRGMPVLIDFWGKN